MNENNFDERIFIAYRENDIKEMKQIRVDIMAVGTARFGPWSTGFIEGQLSMIEIFIKEMDANEPATKRS
jgi:hypothetical protein